MSEYQFEKFSKSYIRALLMDGYISYKFISKGKFYWANVSIYDFAIKIVGADLKPVSLFKRCGLIQNFRSLTFIRSHEVRCIEIERDGYSNDLFRYSLLLERAIREGRIKKGVINDIDTSGMQEDIIIDSLERDVVAETTELMSRIDVNIAPSSIYGAMMYSGKVSPFLDNKSDGGNKAFKNTDKESMDELMAFMESHVGEDLDG